MSSFDAFPLPTLDVARGAPRVPPAFRGSAASLLALTATLALASCNGSIGGTGDPSDPSNPSNPSNPNNPGPVGTPNNPVIGNTGGPIVSAPAASTRFSRLNHQQWENTVRDLLRLPAPAGLSSAFIAEPLRSSFNTNGSVLTVSADLWGDYQTAAETLAKKVARDPALLATHTPAMPTDAAGKARAFIQNFGARAFRRPLTDAETTRYVALFDKGATLFATGNAFADGVELTLAAFLQSPSFVYRTELSTTVANGRIALNDHEIASRLSYSLTNTMPDDALFAAADGSKLRTRDAVVEQAKRLLATPAAQATVADFHDQFLKLRELEAIKKDSPLLPLGIGADLKQETLAFVKDVVFGQEKGLTDLLTAPFTFANSKVAKIYGVTVPTPAAGQPDPFVRIDLKPEQRGGVLTQIGFLAANAEGQTPNSIMRGVRVALDVLCLQLPPPPDNIPPFPAIAPNTTNRQRIETLTMNQPCASCHGVVINPLGFAFENLDGYGAFRTTEGPTNLPINASATYELDGKSISYSNAAGLTKEMAQSKQANECYSRHWVEYLYGRDVNPIDDPADKGLVEQAGVKSKANASVKELILNLVATDAFLTRLP